MSIYIIKYFFIYILFVLYKKMFSINVGECNNLLGNVPMEAMPGNK